MDSVPDDAELLRRYACEGAEDAFAALVQRYIALVYHAARRQLGGNIAVEVRTLGSRESRRAQFVLHSEVRLGTRLPRPE